MQHLVPRAVVIGSQPMIQYTHVQANLFVLILVINSYPLFVSADQQGPGEKGSSGQCARSIRLNRNRNQFDGRIDRSYDWHWNDAGA
jgi:hypothetical protein